MRRRIGQSLIADSHSNRSVVRWRLAGLVAVAACVAVAVVASHMRVSPGIAPGRISPEIHELASVRIPDATLGSYKLAFTQSPDRLDALLDQQAARPLAANDSDVRTFKLFDPLSIP
jgi:hypothetical protein